MPLSDVVKLPLTTGANYHEIADTIGLLRLDFWKVFGKFKGKNRARKP
jgi:hypothetical protein